MSSSSEVTINHEQSVYVIPCGKGYTCLGFDYVLGQIKKLEDWLSQRDEFSQQHSGEVRGSMAAYETYKDLLQIVSTYCLRTKTRCDINLTPELVGLEGQRIEVVDRYGERRRFRVGKSTGWMPCHLEIARKDSSGGPSVSGAPFQSIRVIHTR